MLSPLGFCILGFKAFKNALSFVFVLGILALHHKAVRK
jgi:hypothetical protein